MRKPSSSPPQKKMEPRRVPGKLQMRVEGAPDFGPSIEELLEKAGIVSTPDARSDLDSILQWAWGSVEEERLSKNNVPPQLFEALEDSIKKTLVFLGRVKKFPGLSGIDSDRVPVVEGTVHTPPIRGWFDNMPPGKVTFMPISRQRMLERLLRDIARHNRKRRRGGQPNLEKSIAVNHALFFFRQYSTVKPTSYFHGPFVNFCRRFYEVVTGKTVSASGLEKLIRSEVKKPIFGT